MIKKFAKHILSLLGMRVFKLDSGWGISSMRAAIERQFTLFDRRFGHSQVDAALAQAKQRWPQHQIVLLSDALPHSEALSLATVHCGSDTIECLHKFPMKQTVFVYACDSDAIGLPYIRQIVDDGGTFFPVQIYTPARYSNIDEVARRTLEVEYARQTAEGFQKFDFGPADSLNLTQAIAITSQLPGAYIEIGCFRGSSGCVALAYMRERGMRRECFFLDVFDGFVYKVARESADAMWSGTHATEGIDGVHQRIAASANPSAGLNAYVLKCNIVEHPLPAVVGDIAMANIDVDLYEAVLAALTKVAPRMIVGGVIVVEDPGHTPALIGSRLALQEFLASPYSSAFVPVYLESGQTFLIRVGAASATANTPGD